MLYNNLYVSFTIVEQLYTFIQHIKKVCRIGSGRGGWIVSDTLMTTSIYKSYKIVVIILLFVCTQLTDRVMWSRHRSVS